MELDDFKSAWQGLERQLEQQNALNLHLLRERKLDRMRSGLRPLTIGQGIQLLAGILLCLLYAPFWIEHRQSLHLLVYGLSLHAYGVLLIACAARDLFLISQIDYSAPVLAIQKQLAELRAWHLKIAPVFAITGCLIWVPCVLVLFYWMGADVWLRAPSVVGWLLASGLVALLATWLIVTWIRQPQRGAWARTLRDEAAGHGVNRAQAVLAEIARFEQA